MHTYYNVHTHTLVFRNIPRQFLPGSLIRLLVKQNNSLLTNIARLIYNIFPNHDPSLFDRYNRLVQAGIHTTQEENFAEVSIQNPGHCKIVVMPMDLDHIQAGKAQTDYPQQIEDLAALRRKFPMQILPFVAADPRRRDMLALVRNCIENEGFCGIKIYPHSGFYPFDSRLDPVYAYAVKNNIPVSVHCSTKGIYSRQTITKAMRTHPITGKPQPETHKGKFACNYSNPANYEAVLKKYPELTLCFAHFGGIEQWDEYHRTQQGWTATIVRKLLKYPNTYADISQLVSHSPFVQQLKSLLEKENIKHKVLYGTGNYVLRTTGSEKMHLYKDLHDSLGTELFDLISVDNPKKFLKQ